MSAGTPPKAVHVLIGGRVQGVGFRAWTAREAGALGLDGWVRNLSDGRVEAVFAGAPDSVASMLEKCRKGPMWGRVDEVSVTDWMESVRPGFERRATV